MLLASAPAALGAEGGDNIVGGTPAAAGEYPAQGYLEVDGSLACGGTLVGSTWFLTAAHCVAGATSLAILLGDTDLNEPNTDVYGVRGAEIHPGYDPITSRNDAAMIRLDRPAPYQPLRVIRGDETSRWVPGTTATIVGWGRTSEGGPPSDQLLEAQVPIRSDSECAAAYFLEFDPETMLCAAPAAGGTDTCQGDSGGPLMVSDGSGGLVLAAITSWGDGCARPDKPGVYTRLGAPGLNDWAHARIPRASFSVGPAHSNQAIAFTSTSFHPDGAGGFTAFGWDFNGDGVYEDAVGPSVTRGFPAGVAIAGLRATGPSGDVVVARQAFTVNGSPTVLANTRETAYSVGEGTTVALSGSGSDPEGGPLAFAWDLDGDSTYESVGRETTFSALGLDGPQTRVVSLRACDAAGACATSEAFVRIANVRPRVNAGPDKRVKRNRRVQFFVRATDPGRDALKVTWRFRGKTRKGSRVTHVFRRAGVYRIRVTVTDGDGGSTTDGVRVRVRR